MEPDKYQQAWQAHASQPRVTIDADLLLNEMQREQQNFRAMIFYRDFTEVGISLLLLPLWFFLGYVTSSPWTWYLTVPVLVWMAGFMLVYRKRHQQKPAEPGEPLLDCVKISLSETEAQIWLLRNILWWYLLPPSISITAYFAHIAWLSRSGGWLAALLFFLGLVGFLLAVYSFIYYLNQRAVRLQLEPRRRELVTLLSSLRDETTGAGADDQVRLPALPFAEGRIKTQCASPVRFAIGMFAFVLILLLIAAFVVVMVNKEHTDPYLETGEGYPKRSPFAAVRWQNSQPEIKVGREWFQLVSLNDVPASEIVAFSRRTYGDLWQKRFEEDLVELLMRMGHPPGDTVTLVVQSLTSSETRTLEEVPMTYANRKAIDRANRR